MIDKTSQFFAILTAVGEAKHANAIAMGQDWMFTEMGLGDANGTDPIPDRLQTQLINEWRRAPINQIRVDPANPNTVITEQIIPPEVGGEWIREIGLYDVDGDLVAVANCAPSYKPLLDQGSGKTQVVRMNFIVSSSANIVLKIDPAVVLATREYVDLKIQEELAKLDHKQSARVAATAAITLSNLQTVDDVAVVTGDRVLVTAQALAQDNGVYVVSAEGWTRTADADNSLEVTPGLFIHVEQGSVNGDSLWQLVTDAPITLGTTGLQFEMIVGASGVGAGTYRSVTVDALGRVVAGTNPTTLDGYGITDALPIDGTAVAATQLDTARTLSVSGAASGSATFDGTDDADIAITLADSGVAAGTYSNVTVDEKGLVTGGDQLTGDDLGLGTAAYLNAQVSIDDATAQALMMVGAFGVGGTGMIVPEGSDLDTVILGGLYRVNTGGNIPEGFENSLMLVVRGNDTVAQVLISFQTGAIISRGASGIGDVPVFSAWTTSWNNLNFNPSEYQSALGFTPVQQGGGVGQLTNKVYIGWTNTGLKVTVDDSDLGDVAFLSAPAFINGIQVTGHANLLNTANVGTDISIGGTAYAAGMLSYGNITANAALYAGGHVNAGGGAAQFQTDGNSYGPIWGGYLSTYLGNNYPAYWNLMANIGGQPANGVGTYAIMYIGGVTAGIGEMFAGSSLCFAATAGGNLYGVYGAGTWRLMGYINLASAAYSTSLFLRVV